MGLVPENNCPLPGQGRWTATGKALPFQCPTSSWPYRDRSTLRFDSISDAPAGLGHGPSAVRILLDLTYTKKLACRDRQVFLINSSTMMKCDISFKTGFVTRTHRFGEYTKNNVVHCDCTVSRRLRYFLTGGLYKLYLLYLLLVQDA